MTRSEIAILVRDAFREFISKRADIEQYVNTRYAQWDEKFKASKREQVEQRIECAELICELSSQIAALVANNQDSE